MPVPLSFMELKTLLETGKLCTLSPGKCTHLTTGAQQAVGLRELMTLAQGVSTGE